ncbi:MAG: hypothetical protein HY869_02235 [Chloroflexi bacterium]|nr:hypothetical protein [Chloroflexota bacterium]
MKTIMKRLSTGIWVISLLVLMVAISGCSSNCPPEGKWKTAESVGLIGFEVSECKITFMAIAVDLTSANNRFGSVFAQEYMDNYGSTQTILVPVECTFESDGKFNCKKDYITFTGNFISENEAQGELYLPMGLDLTNGFSLKQTVDSTWSATIVK